MRGVIPMYRRYIDQTKDDDMWMYLPTMRRTRRMSTAQKMDTLGGGMDITWDDFQNFAGKILHDAHPLKLLTVTEIIQKSSNIGMSKVVKRLGRDKLSAYLSAYGFGKRSGIELPGEERTPGS